MKKGILTSEIKVPGTDVKFPAWAMVAGVCGIIAVLIFMPKRGGDQGDFNEEGYYTDDSAGGAWELMAELLDLMSNTGLNEILEPIIDSPVDVKTTTQQSDEPVISYNQPDTWTHEEHPFFVNPEGILSFVAGGAYDVPAAVDPYAPMSSAQVAAQSAAPVGSYEQVAAYYSSPAVAEEQASYTPSPIVWPSAMDAYFQDHPVNPVYTPPASVPTTQPAIDYSAVQVGATIGGDIA